MQLQKINYLVCICLLFFFSACKKENNHTPDGKFTPKPYPVGKGGYGIEKKLVGPEGLNLSSVDGKLELIIPAGALDAVTEISIEMISNTNPGGVGNGFRLKPHDITFNKEVEMKFSYDDYYGRYPVSSPHFLGVTYQDENRYWRYVPSPEIDTVGKKVTIKTRHFSDWALMQWMYLLPLQEMVKPNEQLELRAVRVLPAATADNGYITPLVPPDGTPLMVGEQVDLESKYIKRWALSGNIGKLVAAGNKAVYTAPLSIPQTNPVAVSLELNAGSHQVWLVSNIEIMGADIEFRINGGAPVTFNGMLLKTGDGYMLTNRNNNGAFALKWKGDDNWMPFNAVENTFQYVTPDAASVYLHTYNERLQPLLVSPGHIRLKSVSENAVSGTFSVGMAGHFSIPVSDRIDVVTIEGRFSAKKTGF